jgi:hypothetical protein
MSIHKVNTFINNYRTFTVLEICWIFINEFVTTVRNKAIDSKSYKNSDIH